MSDDLQDLIERAKAVVLTEDQKEDRRQSLAYGNAHFKNSDITRDMIREQAQALRADHA